MLRWLVRIVTLLPVALVLRPILARNFRLRAAGKLPDKMHWADVWMMHCGWVLTDKGIQRFS